MDNYSNETQGACSIRSDIFHEKLLAAYISFSAPSKVQIYTTRSETKTGLQPRLGPHNIKGLAPITNTTNDLI